MALSLTKQTGFGITVDDAYHRIEMLILDSKTTMQFDVKSYASVEYEPFANRTFRCRYDMNGENPYKQAYMYLKTLPEFADAVDC